LFTTRSGKQIPVPELKVPAAVVTSIMALCEQHIERGERLSLLGVLLDVIDKGIRQTHNQWKNGDLSKNRRDFAKAVAPYMRDPVKYAAEIQALAVQYNMITGTPVELSQTEPEPEELTDEQLEAATAPTVEAN
jgi:hypothetical protein